MIVTLHKGKLAGKISAPPSKSFAHRELLAGMLSGVSFIRGLSYSEDILATLDCASSFGAAYRKEKDTIRFTSLSRPASCVFPCRESGSTLRFFLPLALTRFDQFSLQGTPRLIERGVGAYEDCFPNVRFIKKEGEILVQGHIEPGTFLIDASSSSQYVTGLLFALPLLKGDSFIQFLGTVASSAYIDITLEVLSEFGIAIEKEENGFFVKGNQTYRARTIQVEGDHSNAAFLEAFAFLGEDIQIDGLNPNSKQGDKIAKNHFQTLKAGFAEISIDSCIDLAPVLFAFAALNHGAKFIGIRRLAIKESSRAEAMKEELEKAGCQVDIKEDEAIIYPSPILPTRLRFSSHNDHRIAMALSLFALYSDVIIEGAEAINKSYPNFFEDLKHLGMEVSK